MSAQPTSRLTPEQYLEIERAAAFRSEYHDGRLIAMSGGTYSHVLTISNLSFALRNGLAKRDCSVLTSDLRVRAAGGRFYAYPDIAVVCGEPRFADDQKDTLINPILLVEVLSKSTEAWDRGIKFARYREIESLKEYVMVSQTEPRMEAFFRGPEGDWVLREAAGFESVCHFASLNCDARLAEVYRNVVLEA
jgi:Uma2 family endonuclease